MWKTLDLEALREAAGTPGATTSVNVGTYVGPFGPPIRRYLSKVAPVTDPDLLGRYDFTRPDLLGFYDFMRIEDLSKGR